MKTKVLSSIVVVMLAATACTSNVQPSVTQFGNAIVTTKNAEGAFIDAINQKQANYKNIHFLASENDVQVQTDPNNNNTVATVLEKGDSQPIPDSVIPQNATDAINNLLKSLQAYGEAMQALSGDTAATTFDTNVDNLAKQSQSFNASVLQPLKTKGIPTDTQLNEIATAVKDVGNLVIEALISKDVKTAAKDAQDPLNKIINGLKTINSYWSAQVTKNTNNNELLETVTLAAERWNDKKRPPSYEERVALKGIWEKAAIPVTSKDADTALEALKTANEKIAAAGPVASKVEIQNLAQAASDAYKAYTSFLSK